MELWLVAVILRPTKKQADEDGLGAIVVVQPQAVLAKDKETAGMKAFRFVPEEHAGKEDRLEVRVLPFRGAAC